MAESERATRTLIEGRDFWLWPDGTVLPVISGGAPDDPPPDPKPDDPPAPDPKPDDPPAPDPKPDDPPLGPAGEKALEAFKERARRAENETKDLKKKLEDIESLGLSEQEKAVAAAKAEGAAEASSAANVRIVRAEVKALAAGKLTDPDDAVLHLDLKQFELDDDGEVDKKAVGSAIDALVKQKPYLASGAKPGGPGSADGGPRGNQPAQLTRKDMEGMTPEQIVAAKAEGKFDQLLGKT